MAKADWNIEAKKVSVRRILARNSFNESWEYLLQLLQAVLFPTISL
jgi:hypothetical protein